MKRFLNLCKQTGNPFSAMWVMLYWTDKRIAKRFK